MDITFIVTYDSSNNTSIINNSCIITRVNFAVIAPCNTTIMGFFIPVNITLYNTDVPDRAIRTKITEKADSAITIPHINTSHSISLTIECTIKTIRVTPYRLPHIQSFCSLVPLLPFLRVIQLDICPQPQCPVFEIKITHVVSQPRYPTQLGGGGNSEFFRIGIWIIPVYIRFIR